MRLALALALFIGIGYSQQPADMSGTWKLNVEKSTWGKHPKPTNGTVTIVHHEPSFEYSGKVGTGQGTESADQRSFQFNGTIDGKEYPLTGSQGQGMAMVKRVNDRTIESELKGSDGKVMESARTTISPDGKQLRRTIKAAGPNGEMNWSEVYDRQ
jgi:hypothetical protein